MREKFATFGFSKNSMRSAYWWYCELSSREENIWRELEGENIKKDEVEVEFEVVLKIRELDNANFKMVSRSVLSKLDTNDIHKAKGNLIIEIWELKNHLDNYG